ncbi:UNVERIFIED_CONTAM: hypothetical protein RMT77_004229 [Armadillidium vulgare]
MAGFTKRQILTITVFCIAQFCNALSISLQSPFYPSEAAKKGATASEYGFVFGINELVVFVFSPIYGYLLKYVCAKTLNNMGSFTVCVTCTLFGFLEYVNDTVTFLTLSFVIRFVEATGTASFVIAAFSIIGKEFPQNVGATFAMLESSFGMGLIVGPAVGGILYEMGGFKLPFIVIGCSLSIPALLICVLLPKPKEDENRTESSKGMLCFLQEPPILLSATTIFLSAVSIGFVTATLEPHLQPLNLSPFHLGLMFILTGTSYAIVAPIWGKVCDRWMTPQAVWSIGAVIVCIAFLLLGPAPYLNLKMNLIIIIIALLIHGLGLGCQLVSTFTALHQDSLCLGYPDDISTYGLVSGVWMSFFALGNCVGPAVAGILFDTIGFPWGSQLIVIMNLLLFIVTAIYTRLFSNKHYREFFDTADVVSSSEAVTLITEENKNVNNYGTTNGILENGVH